MSFCSFTCLLYLLATWSYFKRIVVSLIEFCATGNPGTAVNFIDTTYHRKILTVEPLISDLVNRESFLLKSILNSLLILKIDHNAFDSWKHKLTQLFGLNFSRRRDHYFLRFLCMYLIAVFVLYMCFSTNIN